MNFCHSLSFNLVSETEKAVKSLYELNDKKDFRHIVIDLSFPLEVDEVPIDIKASIKRNSERLMEMANRYGSLYVKMQNKGVSQNWTNVYRSIEMYDEDSLICVDPDERPMNEGWINAIGNVLRGGNKYAWVSLTMPEHIQILNKSNTIEKNIWGYKVLEVIGNLNWAQGGFSGKFLNETKGIPYLDTHPIYGHLESASMAMMNNLGYTWCMLPDYLVKHTDYEKGSEGSSRLLREWKNDIIFGNKGQITFEEWLKKY